MPACGIVLAITWLLVIGVRESARANNIMVAVKLVALTLFIVVGVQHINTANYHPFAPNGFTGIHHGAAIVFFAYIGFDAISTAAEETKNPQTQSPDRHIGRVGDLYADLHHRRLRAHGNGAVLARSAAPPIRSRSR